MVPFLAFLRAVTDNKDDWMNIHWIPISEACAPCKVNYDFIAHTETLAEDLRHFLNEIGETDRDEILPKTQRRKAEETQLELFGKVQLEDYSICGEALTGVKSHPHLGVKLSDDLRISTTPLAKPVGY
ncbi:CHST9 [Branchiostoma lanceolatum]|uniref:Carbohydrate sulfotransferase n=1 Tax=Branchiostoma lanceolatum TaxID=7740 RepID=A0A8S4MM37_BRALA|nr:CHST9 [Branchiostoma lanceolatum]